ncbi:DEAD/DEAH box helicase [Ketogulonicigenium vulgare]|uniref:DEAD/DEAH box helicase domain protein n=1 Tax=Ketogulonicigenium vulgare (strain WSH-001) TaxID=759362 RepID=F9Y769_KETVW|nr:DEAD/DEAH box helicase [Ketogulonicigenium vulgare]ADO41269.1 DEAD/DEAH box helicase domain protein [Ketogulonicigenium vulgare Y25]AEM42259.1 DEAD/DEAH box helicase domain protein [Ketogulonicigenium vulgare WSH-001]ALJ79879.1 DEAD/DEAH box helicase [Ketogulonicigenium vulgare]ANW32782.1 DEAD/DEAH box helicase [Ketogulonicigenium vulgare]AOZ53095.1 DEAD/DEAH box helicase domain protein [Ketogulonicigenium vulgare]
MDFDMLGLSPRLTKALAELGITEPTPIQAQAIPHAMNGRDVLGLAQTGTGKTAAFGLPMIDALIKDSRRAQAKGARALVLAPTRELAKQIAENLAAYTKDSHLKTVVVTGGAGIGGQIQRMERGTAILVATPGRLIDLLDRKAIDLSQTEFLVLDEADQMLDLGFIHALRRIAPLLPANRQTMLFSATMPKQMEELAASFLSNPIRVQVNPPGQAATKITQSVHFVASRAKTDLLIELLDAHRDELALVFGRTKHGMEKLAKQLENAGYAVAAIHGNKSQGQRDRALRDFRAGTLRVLVATDVAARGLDIPDVRYVYNYELPNVPDNYVHRIGRTARAGKDGQAVAFCAPDEMGDLRDIQKVMKTTIPVASGAPWEVPADGGGAKKGPAGRRPFKGNGGGKPKGDFGRPQGQGQRRGGRPQAKSAA